VISDGVRRGRRVTRVIYGEGGFTLLDAEMADENPDEHGIEELRLSRLLARAAPGSRSGDGHCNPRGILSHCGGARMDGGDGVTLRYCLDCHGHHASGCSCPQREARRYRISAARKARGRHAWRVARTAARQRDGQRCRQCGSSKALAVHHVTPISEGGERYGLDNLVTLCRSCHEVRPSRRQAGVQRSAPEVSGRPS
jgi:5-methylcytosine-specific restriction enzyme A